jgi:hypothetical protein
MALDLSHDRQQAHAYLDRLPPEQVSAVLSLLETMLGPVARSLANFPIENEEIGEEEERAVAEAREWLKRNKAIPHEEVLAELGLSMDDFERMGRTPLPPDSKRRGRLTMAKKIAWADRAKADVAPSISLPSCASCMAWRFIAPEEGGVGRLQDIEPPELRPRVGAYRVRFYDRGDTIEILSIKHRSTAYR